MLNLRLASILEKNKLYSNKPWLQLLEVHFAPGTDADTVIYVCNDNEDYVFQGHTYIAFSFELSLVEKQSQGQLPSVSLRVSNINRMIESQLQQYGGGVDATVLITVVNTADTAGDPDLQAEFTILTTSCDEDWCTFGLGAPNPLLKLFPGKTYAADWCWHLFNDPGMQAALDPNGCHCGYEGTDTSCSYRLEGDNGCRSKNNVANFGGFPAINTTGFRQASPV